MIPELLSKVIIRIDEEVNKRIKLNTAYDVGIEFLSLNEETSQKIAQFVLKYMNQPD